MAETEHGITQEWRQLYMDAVVELDPVKASERLKEAQAGIMQCIESLKVSGDVASAEPLWTALNAVLNLRRMAERER